MKEVVIVGGVRTPIGSHGGAFRDISAQELARIVMVEVLKRTDLDPNSIDDVIFGCCGQYSDAPNVLPAFSNFSSIASKPSLTELTIQGKLTNTIAVTMAILVLTKLNPNKAVLPKIDSRAMPTIVWGMANGISTIVSNSFLPQKLFLAKI